jgi:hypothetical protein
MFNHFNIETIGCSCNQYLEFHAWPEGTGRRQVQSQEGTATTLAPTSGQGGGRTKWRDGQEIDCTWLYFRLAGLFFRLSL